MQQEDRPNATREVADERARNLIGRSWSGRDLLVLTMMFFFTVQVVRSDFFVNDAWALDWHGYAQGTEAMPYQGRVAMIPLLRWAEGNGLMLRGAAKYQSMMIVGSKFQEPVSVEKFMSLVTGLAATLLLLAFTIWYGRRRFKAWWLPGVAMLAILAVSLAVRSEHNIWTAYDLPHTCLFGIAAIFALEGWWVWMLLLFALDVPVRETAIFLLAICVPMGWLSFKGQALRMLRIAGMTGAMIAYWVAWRILIQRRFAHNRSETGAYFGNNLHELLLPHHWPQMLCAGGYLILFIWLERGLLSVRERLMLYGTLMCVPVILYFGVWGETRIWLEFTLPWAVLGARELEQYLRVVPQRRTAA